MTGVEVSKAARGRLDRQELPMNDTATDRDWGAARVHSSMSPAGLDPARPSGDGEQIRQSPSGGAARSRIQALQAASARCSGSSRSSETVMTRPVAKNVRTWSPSAPVSRATES